MSSAGVKVRPLIEGWIIVGDQIVGRVYGSDKFKDGQEIWTSCIVKQEGTLLVTKNSEYELGRPYDKVCPIIERENDE